jgi:hypothetical protein
MLQLTQLIITLFDPICEAYLNMRRILRQNLTDILHVPPWISQVLTPALGWSDLITFRSMFCIQMYGIRGSRHFFLIQSGSRIRIHAQVFMPKVGHAANKYFEK